MSHWRWNQPRASTRSINRLVEVRPALEQDLLQQLLLVAVQVVGQRLDRVRERLARVLLGELVDPPLKVGPVHGQAPFCASS